MRLNLTILFFGIIIFLFQDCIEKKTTNPILVLATSDNFGTYTEEILKTEGFNEYLHDSLTDSRITDGYLRQFDIIILGETRINASHKTMLSDYVKHGGNLIAFRPDKKLDEIFGITNAGGTCHDGYIAIDTTTEQGKGLTSKIMQFHGEADKCEVLGAKKVATLYAEKSSEKGFPAVVSHHYGKGHTVAFLYNLPKSIVHTRQGNPLFAGIEKDGIPGLRGTDLFADGWLDTSVNTFNQADQQMALLSHCIQYMSCFTKPLPRIWYFPDSLKCLVVLDNDGENNTEADFEPQFQDVDSMGAKMTLYIMDLDKVSKAWVDKWVSRGHEIAAHPDDTWEAQGPTWNGMDSVTGDIKKRFTTKYMLTMRTNVNHWFVWCGRNADGSQNFAAQARLEEKHGIEMDGNYAHYDINSSQGAYYLGPPGIDQGNYTGSGLVMKYADDEGKTVNVYQRFNAVYDQQYNESNDPEGFFYCFKGLMDRSLNNEIYSVISIKAHNNEYYFSREPLMKMLAYANENGIPVWTALNLLNFLKMKDEASFTNISWVNNQLSFTLNSSIKHGNGLSFMIPASHGDKKITGITKDNKDVQLTIKSVKGSEYAFVTVEPGANYTFLISYGN